MKPVLEYVSIGGNRNPAAADYNSTSGILAFGAGHGIALWKPLNSSSQGIYAILNGHTDDVNTVRFLAVEHSNQQILLSGAADAQIRIWVADSQSRSTFTCAGVIDAHKASVNCISCLPGTSSFASGAADGAVKIWKGNHDGMQVDFKLVQTINLHPKYFPLAIAWHKLAPKASLLVIGGTKSSIQLYTDDGNDICNFNLVATLTGHDGWIRSLDITRESSDSSSDLLIASASQDKYIRIWRVHSGETLPELVTQDDGNRLGSVERSLSSKAQRFAAAETDFVVSFEALLLGHEDWVYTAQWDKRATGLRLLSASADSSLSLWEPEPTSGVWICNTRLGEISVQKGSTTATGSAGGFFSGLWIDGGKAVTCLGRTGSWRVWKQIMEEGPWKPELGISGHIGDVRGVAWAKDGSYLLSTSSDQTTRLHAEWKTNKQKSWHEFARPQIHGYDLNCIDSTNALQFVSGADEKLLRVFDEPMGTSRFLVDLAGAIREIDSQAHDAASMPVLGLSNKAVEISDERNEETNGDITQQELAAPTIPLLATDHPPYEDDLARHTLWPEREKLYGHGYEISAVASSHDGKIIATACKASSIDHAVIRLYETSTWRELSSTLKAHSLTVTCLRFSHDDKHLLSVGRDRQWAVFVQGSNNLEYVNFASDPKGHSRMILGAAWAPTTNKVPVTFATAGRDKNIKIWILNSAGKAECRVTIQAASSVMTVDFLPKLLNGLLLLASGTEAGIITFSTIRIDDWTCVSSYDLNTILSPSASISQVTWRKALEAASDTELEADLLAIASEDHSLKIVSVVDWVSD